MVEVARLRVGAGFLARAGTEGVVLGEPRHGRRGELGLVGDAGRIRDRAGTCRRLEEEPGASTRDRHEDGRLCEGRLPRVGLHERPV